MACSGHGGAGLRAPEPSQGGATDRFLQNACTMITARVDWRRSYQLGEVDELSHPHDFKLEEGER